MTILVIDNYDSFVYTLSGYFEKLGAKTVVKRNDEISVEEIIDMSPKAIVISPGPCAPKQAGISIELIKQAGRQIPILGVCLGHQAIGEAYGGKTVKAVHPVHGKPSEIEHNSSPLFKNIPNIFDAGRYHSLVCDLEHCNELNITAITPNTNEIMAVQHINDPVFGVQFHPESILTASGTQIISNFLEFANNWNDKRDN